MLFFAKLRTGQHDYVHIVKVGNCSLLTHSQLNVQLPERQRSQYNVNVNETASVGYVLRDAKDIGQHKPRVIRILREFGNFFVG